MELFDSDLQLNVTETPTQNLTSFNYNPRLHLPLFRTAFRAAHFFAALLLFLWIFNTLPAALHISAEFLTRLASVIVTPIFVFLFCNAIIVTLILKPGRFAASNTDEVLYEDLLKSDDGSCPKTLLESGLPTLSPPAAAEEEQDDEIVFQDKEIVMISQHANAIAPVAVCQAEEADSKDQVNFYSSDSDSASGSEVENRRVYRRTRSENLQRKRGDKANTKKLQRSETEKSRKPEESREEEELSDEEFQRAVEEFIAKNLRFRREETMSVVLQSRCSVAQFELKNGIVTN